MAWTQDMMNFAAQIGDFLHRLWGESVIVSWTLWIIAGLAVELIFGKVAPLNRIWLNIRASFVYGVIIFAGGPWVFVVSNAIASKIGLGFIDLSWMSSKGMISQIALAIFNLFVLDLFIYWFHRAQHTIGWMWDIHLVHHSDTDFNVTTTTFHAWPHFVVLAFGVAVPFAVLFKLPEASSAVMGTIIGGWMFVTHLNVRWPLGQWTKLVVMPQFHRIHHSALPEHMNKNLAQFFPIWDIIFGTYWHPAPDEFPPTGVIGSNVETVTEATIYPFKKWVSTTVFRIDRRRQS
jgi:sterol desaturase/sphingolipid hydroxylase (fatty acid hydroxylase superfamily)